MYIGWEMHREFWWGSLFGKGDLENRGDDKIKMDLGEISFEGGR
jgi:hypothetical protein